jgi:site-specific DNA-cytosine methylase
MRALVGFECSGVIRRSFRELGYNAWSCDLKKADDDSGYHYNFDIFHAIKMQKWDLIILHPPCTALAVSGNAQYAKGKPKHQHRLEAISYIKSLWYVATLNCRYVCLENPQGVIHTNTALPKPQYIQPYQFGDDASKKTGLTLYGLPQLRPTLRIKGRIVNGVERWSNQTDSGQNRLGPSPERAALRSKTYPGIAKAMADQWGRLP